jgi:hypothetical protein
MGLTQAEEGFRALKTDLGLRPNYHQKEDRVDSPTGWSSRFSVFFRSVPDTLKRELQRIPYFSVNQ